MVLERLDPQTIGRLIDNSSDIFADLVKDRMVHKRQKDLMREKMTHQKELAEVRGDAKLRRDAPQDQTAAQHTQPAGQARQGDPIDLAIDAASQVEQNMKRVYDETDCGFCKSAIEYMAELPVHQQRQGMEELRELKSAIEGGAERDELESMLDGFEVLGEPEKYM